MTQSKFEAEEEMLPKMQKEEGTKCLKCQQLSNIFCPFQPQAEASNPNYFPATSTSNFLRVKAN